MKNRCKIIIKFCLIFIFAIIIYFLYENRSPSKIVLLKYSFIRGSSPFSQPRYYYEIHSHKKNEIRIINILTLNENINLEDFKISYLLESTEIWEVKHSIRKKSTKDILFEHWDYRINIENNSKAKLLIYDDIIQEFEQYRKDTCLTVGRKSLCNISVYRCYLEEYSLDWYTDCYIDLSKQLLLRVYSRQFGDMDFSLDLVQADTVQIPSDSIVIQLSELFDWLNKNSNNFMP